MKVIVSPKKGGVKITPHEFEVINAELRSAYAAANRKVAERWDVSIRVEAV